MAEARILQKMGPKNKRELEVWRKQERDKQKAIENAFQVNAETEVKHEERD